QKQKWDPKTSVNPFDALNSFKLQEQNFNLKLLPDEKVDGKPCWAIELVIKDPAARAMMGRTVTYYDKNNGIGVKSVTTDKDGKVTTTSTTTDIKLNADIKPDKFVFKAPEGVKVQDLTATEKTGDAKKGDK